MMRFTIIFLVCLLCAAVAEAQRSGAKTARVKLTKKVGKLVDVSDRSELSKAAGLYYAEIAIGTPEQKFPVRFRLNQDDSIISINTNKSELCRYYDKTKSSSFALVKKSDSEDHVNETIRLGDSVKLRDFSIKTNSDEMRDDECKFGPSIELGLDLEMTPRVDKRTSLVEQLVEQGQISEPIFSVHLGEDSGEILFGGIDESKHSGKIEYVDLKQDRFLSKSIRMEAWKVGTKSKQLDKAQEATFDLITDIFGTKEEISAINEELGAKPVGKHAPSVYKYENGCPQLDKLPVVTLTIEGKKFNIPPRDYVIKRQFKEDEEACYSAFASPPYQDKWVLGIPFLRSYYTVFDYGKKRIGFAESI